jgi:hypothetical protein
LYHASTVFFSVFLPDLTYVEATYLFVEPWQLLEGSPTLVTGFALSATVNIAQTDG